MIKKTNKQLVKDHLTRYGLIKPSYAFTVLGVYRLSDCILKLRNEGMSIITVMFKTKSGKEYGVYYFDKNK